MSAALLKEHEPSLHARERGNRIANAQLSAIAADLRHILMEDNAFQKWQVEAIIDIVVGALRQNERLDASAWQKRLHSKGFPKEFAQALASKLSNK
ncbi:hypothetical protein FJ959_09910 [Mesorhizobium sp. B2-2-4]|uniref:hypothetical protein n=1 Tax=unclassified Mesorhizobium TaxID=325217 RepID=UPI001129EFAF|nr:MULTISPECIES: hypothetical protein [unclassified Mesorhizobium]TPM59174.1 hypothetical protein FJ959_09910 [Mesorhizobium sp. B2-2-4]TPM67659.1 hypothetical protein FJ965_11050 [Mesorhizobium sp. B2-2-1]TPN66940.1 hypothetical protein FJ984_15910 [Mesorhizobium sp. B1-1-3]